MVQVSHFVTLLDIFTNYLSHSSLDLDKSISCTTLANKNNDFFNHTGGHNITVKTNAEVGQRHLVKDPLAPKTY